MVDGHERTPSSSSSSSSAILRLPGENRFAFPPDRDGSASFNRLSRKLFDDSSFHPWTQTCSWYRKSIGEFLTLSSTTRYFSFSFFSREEKLCSLARRGANPTRSSACDEIWRNVIAWFARKGYGSDRYLCWQLIGVTWTQDRAIAKLDRVLEQDYHRRKKKGTDTNTSLYLDFRNIGSRRRTSSRR